METKTLLQISSSEDEEYVPFEERVRRLMDAGRKRINNSRQENQKIHSISDSEESDSKETICSSQNSLTLNKILLGTEEKNPFKAVSSSSEDELPNLISFTKVSESEHSNQAGSITTATNDDDDDILEIYEVPKKFKQDVPKSVSESKQFENETKIKLKEEKMRIREEKKKEKELAKALKASEREILKNKRPEECLKNMKIVIDHNILNQDGSQSILNALDQTNLNYTIEENIIKNSVVWYRTVANVTLENNQILKEEKDELTNTLLLIIPNEEFLKLVHAFVLKSKGKHSECLSLSEYIVNVKNIYPDMEITCVIAGFNKFIRLIKEEKNSPLKVLAKEVHKTATEEAVLELQLQAFINFNFLDNMVEIGNLLLRFTKAICEAPHRKEKEQLKSLAFSWYADADSSCPVKLGNDSSSFIRLWQQQLQQFQNVSAEVAQAIVSQYPSFQHLLEAYKRCISQKEAENILQDIVVRRNYGPLGTQKRIGPELSYKIYLFLTSQNGNQLLKR